MAARRTTVNPWTADGQFQEPTPVEAWGEDAGEQAGMGAGCNRSKQTRRSTLGCVCDDGSEDDPNPEATHVPWYKKAVDVRKTSIFIPRGRKEIPKGKALTVILLCEDGEVEANMSANEDVFRAVHAALRNREGAVRLRIAETLHLRYGGIVVRPGSTFEVSTACCLAAPT